MFSFSFADADQKHSEELRKAIMVPEVGDTMDILAGCYGSFLERNPALRGPAGQVGVDVALVKDDSVGGIAVDAEYRARLGTETDAEFAECMRESSFALDYEGGKGKPDRGTVRITMEFPDRSSAGQDRKAATRACFDDLERRRPEVSLSGSIDDETFARCMDRAVGVLPMANGNEDPEATACYDAARKRLPSATDGDVLKSDEFLDCLNRITD